MRTGLLEDQESGVTQSSPTEMEADGVGNEVSQSFHHDGKNCLSTQVLPNQSSWEAERGLWGVGGEGVSRLK